MPSKKIRPNLDVAIALLGGIEKTSRALNISRDILYRWRKGLTPIPGERAIEIENLTQGYVKRSDLRPDFWPPDESED